MKVQLERSFPLPASADTAWTLLQDIDGVAGCMPGAKITESSDERHHKGTMAVRFGPASLTFRGEVEVVTMDAATRTLKLSGKGTDTTGGSGAAMDLTARVDPVDAASCNLIGNSEVAMSGKAAAFGARMATSVADQVMKQFVANFAARAQALQAQAAAPPAPSATGAVSAAAAPAPVAELNGLALVWALIRDWFRSLFGARGA